MEDIQRRVIVWIAEAGGWEVVFQRHGQPSSASAPGPCVVVHVDVKEEGGGSIEVIPWEEFRQTIEPISAANPHVRALMGMLERGPRLFLGVVTQEWGFFLLNPHLSTRISVRGVRDPEPADESSTPVRGPLDGASSPDTLRAGEPGS